MRRDTIIFGLVGAVFGFVVGYMSASWSRPTGPGSAAPASAEAAPAPPSSALDPNEARALEALAGRDPDDLAVRVELGNLYMDHERWDDAIRWYREAVALSPADPNVLTDLGASLVHSGRPAEGLAEFEKALVQDEGHRNALYNKGIALLQLGRTDEAVAAWEEVLSRYPGDPQLRGLRAQIDSLKGTAQGTGQ
ncbi:MAG: tetratricopeptide repeat protein [Acidobacteria bacterium]|jgi:cytochrome c-type biogenesis protein CcmH/NrfG|nr:tetratricopeptide repeat protein [Acidobacteriota bacterium]